ncbi:hypothetical protein [Clostridium tarantellae]|uniref:Uncharacterized protein n=1 Tax=Clostridium tarantellae TaxID=39493 RepID=A0A6I1MR99_9CLOT|nr:hypothetical protein [Clostridium tarantellae]MPQ45240.1 hypothetical protein [Clostridium tarantellae]
MLKNKGFLMIDLVISLAISTILFWSILSIYSSYHKNKSNYETQVEVYDILRGISLEIKNNISFEFFNSLEKGKEYFLNINNIKDLISNDFKELVGLKENNIIKLWNIKVIELEKDKKLNVEIRYKNSNNEKNYKLEEVVTKSIYLE